MKKILISLLISIIKTILFSSFILIILLSFLVLLKPNHQWLVLLLIAIIPLILGFFTIFESSYDIYISILTKKISSNNSKPFNKKSIFIFLIFSLIIWNFNLYLKDGNYLVFTLMVIPYLKEKDKILIKDIFTGLFLYFILSILLNQFENSFNLKNEPFNKYIYYSFKNYKKFSEDTGLTFVYTLFKASLFAKFYLVIIRIINKLLKDNLIEEKNIDKNNL